MLRRVGRVSLSLFKPTDSLDALEISSKREFDSGGLVEVEAGLLDAIELGN
jgi:hypothetical protein